MRLFIAQFEKIEAFVCCVLFGREANRADLLWEPLVVQMVGFVSVLSLEIEWNIVGRN